MSDSTPTLIYNDDRDEKATLAQPILAALGWWCRPRT